uniref:Uncharacterized protein n=1 Tax=Xenopus tropicalis TaxID=8364 RepID=A0A803JEQ8_XENTR
MEAADLRAELSCSVCRDIYTDPVTLPCGHNFCLICIGKTWDWQEGVKEDPSCPECRQRYRRKPELKRNLTLRNIAERFLSTDPEPDGTENSGNRICSTHNKLLDCYCCEDGAPICVSCYLAGGHRGHRVELLSEASEKKKEKLRKVLEKLSPEREETEGQIQRLQERRREGAEVAAVMAAADLRAELSCSVCRDIYTNPVTLPCGHNFCLICIGKTWDWQEGIEEDPSCPECRQRYRRKPELKRNLTLRNIAERFLSTDPEPDGTGNSGNRICSTHNKLLDCYCYDDGAPVCVSCYLAGGHRGHRVELLSEASEKKKEKLRKVLEKLSPEREETEGQIQRLQERRREGAEVAAGETERVTALFRGIREELEALEKRLLSDISRQKEELSLTLTELIQHLEIKRDELSRKIRHIEELCNMADPLTVLQEQWESHGAAFCGAEGADTEGREREGMKDLAEDLDVGRILETLLTGLAGIVTGVEGRWFPGQEATELVLDINTAGNLLSVSGDGKSASYSRTDQRRPQTPERFHVSQALSTRSFPSGRHYWEVEGSKSGCWRVGAAYPSIERGGGHSWFGNNNKSWYLYKWSNKYSVGHDSKNTNLPHVPSCRRIRISLDYEAGRLSFYELSEPIRHLHTFTASFTEPLHAAFWVWGDGAWVRITS